MYPIPCGSRSRVGVAFLPDAFRAFEAVWCILQWDTQLAQDQRMSGFVGHPGSQFAASTKRHKRCPDLRTEACRAHLDPTITRPRNHNGGTLRLRCGFTGANSCHSTISLDQRKCGHHPYADRRMAM